LPAIDLIAGCATSLPLKPLRSPDQNDNLFENRSRCVRREELSLEGPVLASIGLVSYVIAIDMSTVTVSPKFQVVIPQAIREALRITAGEKLRVMIYGDRLEFVPVRPIKEMRGFLRGMDSQIEQEEDRL
jgi:AbrB family looped-hinge helix DNA binding protein